VVVVSFDIADLNDAEDFNISGMMGASADWVHSFISCQSLVPSLIGKCLHHRHLVMKESTSCSAFARSRLELWQQTWTSHQYHTTSFTSYHISMQQCISHTYDLL